MEKLKTERESNCLHCNEPIQAPKRKFCCSSHKNLYNQKHLYGSEYTNKSRSKSPENFIKSLMTYYKRRLTLKDEDVIRLYYNQQGKCALSGRIMTFIVGSGYQKDNISIDRIDSTKGYIIDNVQLVCRAVNVFKQQLTEDEFIEFCTNVAEYRAKK